MEDHQPTEEVFAAIGDTFVVETVKVFDMVKSIAQKYPHRPENPSIGVSAIFS